MKVNIQKVANEMIQACGMSLDIPIDSCDSHATLVNSQTATFEMTKWHDDRNKPNLLMKYTVTIQGQLIDLDQEEPNAILVSNM